MAISLWPGLGMTAVLDEEGGTVPAAGISISSLTPYYEALVVRGHLVTYDPLDADSSPATVTTQPTIFASTTTALALTEGGTDTQIALVSGHTTAGDGGGGLFTWYAGDSTTADGATVLGTGSGRWKRVYSGPLNVRWFGAAGDGSTDDSSAITTALAALPSGGALYIPSGTYRVNRGTGSLGADNIVADGVTIFGDGAKTVLDGRKSDGTLPDDVGNQHYNIFQGTSRSNLTIRDMRVTGYCSLATLFICTNVSITGVSSNGLLANAGTYLRDKALYLDNCVNVRIADSDFNNDQFSIYLGGATSTRCKAVTVTGCTFRQTAAAGAFTSLFPVGVYAYFADDVTVSACTFEDIYSSFNNGTTGTGLGYGVYEGDGDCTQLTVAGCTFRYAAKGTKNATGVQLNEAESATVTGCTFHCASAGRMTRGVLSDIKVAASDRVISNNTFIQLNTSLQTFPIYSSAGTTTSTLAGSVNITGNTVSLGTNGVRIDYLGNCRFAVSNNVISASLDAGIRVTADATVPHKHVQIIGNSVRTSGLNAVYMAGYCVGTQIIGNMLLDGNTTGAAGDTGYGVWFSSNSFGSQIANNTIGNTAHGGGLFVGGVQNSANATSRIFKDITVNNTFIGIANNLQFGRYWTSTPTNGIFDVSKGDFFQNVQLNASGVPGWYCVQVLTPTLTASVSSTTVTCDSTSSMAVGDIVLLTVDANPYDADYYTAANWHTDTVASITDPTHFELTTGIGGETYTSSGTCTVARFKAAAAVAA